MLHSLFINDEHIARDGEPAIAKVLKFWRLNEEQIAELFDSGTVVDKKDRVYELISWGVTGKVFEIFNLGDEVVHTFETTEDPETVFSQWCIEEKSSPKNFRYQQKA